MLQSQNESQLFAKIMQLNCINFEYEYCNFSKKHMNYKDRCEELSKEGCGRVVAYKSYNIIYSYTLECGYHSNNYCFELPIPYNVHKKYSHKGYTECDSEYFGSDIYKRGPPLYTPKIYE